MIITPASADALHSSVGVNTGIGDKTADRPANGVRVADQVKLQDGDLDGCTVDIIESVYGHDEGSRGIFDIPGDVNCTSGGFADTSSGAWDGHGFHASGDIKEVSSSGDFEGIVGRIAQLGGAVAAAVAGDGTLDVSYEFVVDKISD